MNTAALAKAAELPRSRLKHVLSGAQPITVDEFVALANALQLTQEDLGLPAVALEPSEEEAAEVEEGPATAENHGDSVAAVADPYGNHTAQAIQLGFALGCDLFFVADTSKLADCGLPQKILADFPDQMPIKLDAAFHRHNAPRFSDEGLTLMLSFDTLYTCCFPWEAFKQVTFFPLPPKPTIEDPLPKTKSPTSHLRLVE